MAMLPMLTEVYVCTHRGLLMPKRVKPLCTHKVDAEDRFCRMCGTQIGNSIQRFARSPIFDRNVLRFIRKLLVTKSELNRYHAALSCINQPYF